MTSTLTISRPASIELQDLDAASKASPTPPSLSGRALGSNDETAGSEELMQNIHVAENVNELSKKRAAVVITTVAGVNFLNTMGSGILTVALPTMAKDLGLSVELLLWYV